MIQLGGLFRMQVLRMRYGKDEEVPWIAPLATALQHAQLVYLIGAAFVGIAFQPFLWMLIGTQIALDAWCARRRAAAIVPPDRPSRAARTRDGLAPIIKRRRSVPPALHEGIGEGRDVVGLAAGDQIAVHHDFLVHHVGAGIFQVGADRRPAGHPFSVDDIGLDQQPRRMADRRNGFSSSSNSSTIAIARSFTRSLSGLPTPPGNSNAS